MADDARPEIQKWLVENGYTAEEIAEIMGRVTQYDDQKLHDSWFDSLGGGEFSIHKIIREALGREPNKEQ